MKPSPFAYSRAPRHWRRRCRCSPRWGSTARCWQAGRAWYPILNMRLAAPAHIIDINRIPDLAFVRVEEGGVRMGALARHADVERDDPAFRRAALAPSRRCSSSRTR